MIMLHINRGSLKGSVGMKSSPRMVKVGLIASMFESSIYLEVSRTPRAHSRQLLASNLENIHGKAMIFAMDAKSPQALSSGKGREIKVCVSIAF